MRTGILAPAAALTMLGLYGCFGFGSDNPVSSVEQDGTLNAAKPVATTGSSTARLGNWASDRLGFFSPRLAEELGLDDVQKATLDTLRTEFKAAWTDLKGQYEAGTITEDDFKAQMKVLENSWEEEWKALLTPEQETRLEELEASWGQWPGHGADIGAGFLKQFARELALTVQQVDILRGILSRYQAEWQSNVKEFRAGAIDRETLQSEQNKLREGLSTEVATALNLTDEQIQKWNSLRSARKQKLQGSGMHLGDMMQRFHGKR